MSQKQTSMRGNTSLTYFVSKFLWAHKD